MRLALDEHFSAEIAAQLRERGHDVVAIGETDLVGRSDADVWAWAAMEKRALLTENVADFMPLVQEAGASGDHHYGVVFSSSQSWPRAKGTTGRFVDRLDDPTVGGLVLTSDMWLAPKIAAMQEIADFDQDGWTITADWVVTLSRRLSARSARVWRQMADSLRLDQARRIALAAQGLAAPARRAAAGPAALRAALDRLGAIQIDSINVVARSHELVLAARAGPHDPAAFERLVYRRRAGFEYWGHAASFLPIGYYRLFLPRMRRLAVVTRGWWADVRRRNAALYGPVLDRIRAEGPLPASAYREPSGPRRGTWWDWAPAKHVLEDLFDQGTLLVHDRVNFERRYDLAESCRRAWTPRSRSRPRRRWR